MAGRLHFTLAVLALVAGLGACDVQRIEKLEEGVATEADVRAQFGEPAAVYPEADGSKTLEYPRQPAGQRNYMITIGADGRMSALRQVLKDADFARVVPGLNHDQVRRLLGQPARMRTFQLKQEELWEWRYLDGMESRVFNVVFDGQGRVLRTSSEADLRQSSPGG